MLRDKIKTEVAKRGLTPYKLAVLSGLQPNQVRRYLSGRTDIQGDNIDKMLRVLGVQLTTKRKSKQAKKLKAMRARNKRLKNKKC